MQDDIAKKIRENAKDVLKVICKMLDVDDICLNVIAFQYWMSKDHPFFVSIYGFNFDRCKCKIEHICKLRNGRMMLEIPSKYYDKTYPHIGKYSGIWFISEFSRRTSIDEDEFTADIVEMLCRCLASNDGLSARETVSNVQPEELLIKVDLDYGV